MSTPLVSVIVPCRNEESSIVEALSSVDEQSMAHELIEVVVVDGGSSDETAAVAKQWLADRNFHRGEVIGNPIGTTPSNLNAGLEWARGTYIVRLDARSRFPSDYIERIVSRFEDPAVSVVGGSQVALPPTQNSKGRSIARALNNRFGMGLSRYRRHGAPSGAVDTVYLGSFRREQLVDASGWNEEYSTNQDFELNQRMQSYGTVWFEAGLPVGYVPRSSVGDLWRQYHRFGRAKAAYWRRSGAKPQRRQQILIYVPPILAIAGVGSFAIASSIGRVMIAVAGAGGLVGLDVAGSAERSESTLETLMAPAISVVVGMAWWTGVAVGILGGDAVSGPSR